MNKLLRPFWLALGFLTRIPTKFINNANKKDWGYTLFYYPLIGLLIGLLLTLVSYTPSSPILVAAIVTAFWVYITGSLHIDGLADWADAFVGGIASRERTFEILKDPVSGPTAIAVTCLHLLIKFSAIYTVIEQQIEYALLLAPLVARTLIILMISTSNYITKEGIASFIIQVERKSSLKIFSIIILLFIGVVFSINSVILAIITMFLLRSSFIKRLGGISGDTLGATVEITEAIFLVGMTLNI